MLIGLAASASGHNSGPKVGQTVFSRPVRSRKERPPSVTRMQGVGGDRRISGTFCFPWPHPCPP